VKFLATLLSVLILAAVTGSGILFALQNSTRVPLDVLVYTFEPHSVALWVLGAFAVGGVLGVLMSSGLIWRKRAALLTSERQLKRAREDLAQLRSGSGR
jgi:uncharacterized membrane protein YciS (DUF1049 family)